ncbi:MAG: AAA family ATPase [Chloroflexota bacterium]
MPNKAPIFLLTGTPGAGKTSVSNALMKRFPFGLHIPVDNLREWVVSGLADPVPVWTAETTRQFRLARNAAAHTARLYADAGFAVVIDDVIWPHEAAELFEEPLEPHALHKVLLRPDLDSAQARNATRTNKSYDTEGLRGLIEVVHDAMLPSEYEAAGWAVVDSTHLSLEETVDEILKHLA